MSDIDTAFNLTDPTDRLVYADLLEEQGRDSEAALLRKEQVPVTTDDEGRVVVDTEALVASVREAYEAATGTWTGCDWTQPFGWRVCAWLDDDESGGYADEMDGEFDADTVGSVDLAVEIRDARRAAKSCGWSREDRDQLEEAIRAAYESAQEYAEECSSAASAAEEHAAEAADLAESGQWHEALEAAKEACRVEAQFGDCPTWGSLREAIEEAIEILDSLDD